MVFSALMAAGVFSQKWWHNFNYKIVGLLRRSVRSRLAGGGGLQSRWGGVVNSLARCASERNPGKSLAGASG